MNPPASQALHQHTLLARCLQDMGIGNKRPPSQPLVDNLAEHISLTDAFTMSDKLRELSRLPFTAQDCIDHKSLIQEIKTGFIDERTRLINTLIKKSTPAPDNRHLQPGKQENIETLKRFYILQQNDMDQHIQKLRLHIRDVMKGISSNMQKLAMLDAMMAETVAKEARKAFATIPQKLQTRFHQLQQEPHGYDQCIHDLQSLLLAELEIRLLPLMGLIEALDDEIKKTL